MLANRKGFTLIELLVVIAILATLAVTVFVAINPAKRFQDSRNARRQSDVATILDAVHTSTVDNGDLPTTISGLTAGTMYELSTGPVGSATVSTQCTAAGATGGLVDVMTAPPAGINDALAQMPVDPQLGTTSVPSGYAIQRNANNMITITACGAENGVDITASR